MKRLLFLFLLVAVSASAQQVIPKLPGVYRPAPWVLTAQKGLYLVVRGEGENTRCAYADSTGRILIKTRYPYAEVFRNGYAVVGEGPFPSNKKGLIDSLGRLVTPVQWNHVGNVVCGCFPVTEKSDEGVSTSYYLNTQGEKLFGRSFPAAKNFSEGVAVIGVGTWSPSEVPDNVRLSEGYTLNPADMASKFCGKYGLIDTLGREIAAPIYELIMPMHEGLAVAAKAGEPYPKYGFLDREGNEAIPFEYYRTSSFSEGLAVVCKPVRGKLKYGYIDASGREVLPLSWDHASPYRFGVMWVGVKEGDNMRFMLLNRQGEELLSQWVYDLDDGGNLGHASCAIVDGEGYLRYGLVSSRGKVIIPFEYDRITLFSEPDPVTGLPIERGIAYRGDTSIPFTLGRRE